MTTMTTIDFDTARLMADIRQCMPGDSLRTIADESSVSASTLSRLDKGSSPDMASFMALCAAFDLNPGDYFKRVVWQRVEDNSGGKRVK